MQSNPKDRAANSQDSVEFPPLCGFESSDLILDLELLPMYHPDNQEYAPSNTPALSTGSNVPLHRTGTPESTTRKRTMGSPDHDLERDAKKPKPNPSFSCHWEDCRTVCCTLSELRKHARNHTKRAVGCRWLHCTRPVELRGQLNKHLDCHIKPHECPEPGCSHRAATSRDMERHIRLHGPNSGSQVFFCPVAGCPRGQNGSEAAFKRFDNAARHVKLKHPPVPVIVNI